MYKKEVYIAPEAEVIELPEALNLLAALSAETEVFDEFGDGGEI